jgi:selenocysteine lyase/cysteine desulfurase
MQCAFLFGTSRKWLRGPRGVGFLYVRRHLANELRPAIIGYPAATWLSAQEISLAPDMDRFRIADQPYALYAGFATAASTARRRIAETAVHNASIGSQLREALAALPHVELYDVRLGTTGTVPFNITGLPAEEAVPALERQGIRVSLVEAEHCRLSFERLGISSLIRASAHHTNSPDDVERLAGAIADVVATEGAAR